MRYFKDSQDGFYAAPVAFEPLPHWTEITQSEWATSNPSPVAVPQSVTRFQALAALHLAGHLPAVEAIMAAPETPTLAKLAWDNALSFERNSPNLASLAAMLGMTDADLDALFTTAATIEA